MFSVKKEHVPEEAVKRSSVLSDLLSSNGASGPVPVSAEAIQTWAQYISRTVEPQDAHVDDRRTWSQILDNLLVLCCF